MITTEINIHTHKTNKKIVWHINTLKTTTKAFAKLHTHLSRTWFTGETADEQFTGYHFIAAAAMVLLLILTIGFTGYIEQSNI